MALLCALRKPWMEYVLGTKARIQLHICCCLSCHELDKLQVGEVTQLSCVLVST